MAQPRLKADFFARPDGVCVVRAPPLTGAEKRSIFERDGRKCRLCGKPTKFSGGYEWNPSRDVWPSQIDHVIPRARGGQNDPSNLQLLCQPCNSQKGNKTPEELRAYLEKLEHKNMERRRGAHSYYQA